MAYSPNTWAARQGVGLNRFQDQNGNIYELTPVPTEVTQTGTPFSVDWMNHIENGLQAAAAQADNNAQNIAKTADFIVEQGTSGMWAYRKWNSGMAECWGVKAATMDVTSVWGACYETPSSIVGDSYPFSFIELPNVQMTILDIPHGSGIWLETGDGGNATVTNPPAAWAVRASSAYDLQLKLYYSVKGRWK